MKKVLIIFGTRPEAIKLAPVISALKVTPGIDTIVCSTGQHREMLKQVLDIFSFEIDYDLDIMKADQDLFDITINSLNRLKEVLVSLSPDLLIVQGDTTTAFVASLAAYYCKIKVGHVEAGLRSYNILSPYPEEANRRFITPIADYNFAPTKDAAKNLTYERIASKKIFVTGNTVIDALLFIKNLLKDTKISDDLSDYFDKECGFILNQQKYILLTLHRREKFGAEFEKVLKTLKELSLGYPSYKFIYPVHLNPNVKLPVEKYLSSLNNFVLLPPQDYLKFIYLMSNCYFIMSDSGGVQEECFVFRKPIIVMRDVTERNEAIKAGYAFLVGSDDTKIKKTFTKIDKKLSKRYNFFKASNPFGDGKASRRIANVIKRK